MRTVVAALAVAGAAVAAMPTTADAHTEYWSKVYKYTDDHDPGGSSGSVTLYPTGTKDPKYAVQFQAKGENLYVKNFTGGGETQARVRVWDTSGNLVDEDLFTTDKLDTAYNLGTPDGSGDIAEGYRVGIQVRPAGGSWSLQGGYTA